ncbi:unnamed protein product [Prunus brigantina]
MEGEEMNEEEMDEEFYETIKHLLMAMEAVVQVLHELMVMLRSEHIELPLIRRPITTSRYDYIHKILHEDPEEFRQVYRMYPDVFRKLCTIIRDKTLLQDTRFICVEEMLATFLLTDCIGVIDGTHILAMVKGCDVSSYLNRHGRMSQNVLVACNFDLEFIYVLSGWEGSAHDSKVLNDALSRRNGLKVPQGHDLENAIELFNLRHASLRNVIERIFAIFKSRFTIFKSAPPFPYRTQVERVLACAGLHNFLRRECRSNEFPIEPENESSSSSPLLGNERDNVEQVFETQEQQRENANEWRVGIASDMWRNATQDNNVTQR